MTFGSVHFIGLCGAGMSAVARIYQQEGWTVTGSDEGFYPPMSDVIRGYGIPCATPYRPENVPDDARWIVIGRHAKLTPDQNAEVAEAFRRRDTGTARVLSFPEALAELTRETENVVVAGSFGKSSCTALAAWVLTHAGKEPGYFLGAAAIDLPDNGRRGAGKVFVFEGDEYPAANDDARSKFLFYRPRRLLLISGEHDHVNVFPTLDDYLKPFAELVGLLPTDGTLVACDTGAHLTRVVGDAKTAPIWYGLHRSARTRWWAEAIQRGPRTTFTLVRDGRPVTRLSTQLLGDHALENIVGVAALLLETGAVTADELAAGVAAFSGVRRRLERLTPDDALPLYNDFGSSRAKCRAGIDALKTSFPDRRLVVCFEPHTFSFRSRDAIGWYDTLFSGVKRVFVYQPPTHGAVTHDQLTQSEIVARIAGSGVAAEAIDGADDLLARLQATIDPARDLIVFETSGGFDGAIPRAAAWAQEQHD